MESDKSRSVDAKGLKLIFRALTHRNYRLFFRRKDISMIGTWMTSEERREGKEL